MGDFAKLDLERELNMIDLNISALVALTHHYLPAMRDRKSGVVINVSSAASFQPIPFFATYAATKAFVSSFTEAIAEENRPFGIKVLALCPGATETDFFNNAKIEDPMMVKGMQKSEDVVEAALKAVRKGKPLVVSGFSNYVGSVFGTVFPNSIITRVIAKGLRKKYQG
jgi:short-subunit dehydrogenase